MFPHNPRVLSIGSVEEARAEIEKIGTDTSGLEHMALKGVSRAIKLEGVDSVTANSIKELAHQLRGDASLARAAWDQQIPYTDVIVWATLHQYRELVAGLKEGTQRERAVGEEIERVLELYSGQGLGSIRCGDTVFEWGSRTYVTGIINVTPDSFSGDGVAGRVEEAIERARNFVAEGADIIDIGGESTRPGHSPVSAEQELARVMPVIEAIVKEVKVPISIDTYKAGVARRALQAGASMLNDVWGLKADPDMAKVAAEFQVPVILMHNQKEPNYRNLMSDLIRGLRESIDIALAAGLRWENIIVDPGIGFGKTKDHNLEIMAKLEELKVLGRPVLVGTSRKSTIGLVLNLPVDQRLEGTAATVALAIANGADIVRVHDVQEMIRVARMSDAIVRKSWQKSTSASAPT